jgi:hypothetical protein
MARIALFAWIPLVLSFFTMLRPRHAVLAAYLGGWLFLPVWGMRIAVLPDLDKVTVTSMSVLLGVALFDANRLLAFRPRWFDLPMLAWCVAPFFSSIDNRLGYYDGASALLAHAVQWGLPYLIGRLYFADYEGVRELAVAIFVGGLVYVPLCWIEMRLSPQLHVWVYGIRQHSFAQAVREGGYRPMVFMQHGLAVAMWMTAASLCGVWLWLSGSLRRVLDVPVAWLLPLLLLTTILCRSKGATLCLMAGLGVLVWVRYARNAFPLLLLVALAPSYMLLRTAQYVQTARMLDLASHVFPPERLQSLATRLNAEDLLTERAMQAKWFGWGRWNPDDPPHPKWRVYNEKGKDIAPTDGLWVIVLGTTGIVGLAAITTSLLLPVLLYRHRVPPGWWAHPLAAPGAALAVLLPLYMIDCLMNAMLNPVFVLAVGGLAGLGAKAPRTTGYAVRQPDQRTGGLTHVTLVAR